MNNKTTAALAALLLAGSGGAALAQDTGPPGGHPPRQHGDGHGWRDHHAGGPPPRPAAAPQAQAAPRPPQTHAREEWRGARERPHMRPSRPWGATAERPHLAGAAPREASAPPERPAEHRSWERDHRPGAPSAWRNRSGPQPQGVSPGADRWRGAAAQAQAVPSQRTERRLGDRDVRRGDHDGRTWRDHDRGGWDHNRPHWDSHRYAHEFRSHRRYHAGRFYWPRGYPARVFGFGAFLPPIWWSSPTYQIADWWDYDLPYPPPGYVWVRVGDDALLVDEFDGRVVQVVRDLFW